MHSLRALGDRCEPPSSFRSACYMYSRAPVHGSHDAHPFMFTFTRVPFHIHTSPFVCAHVARARARSYTSHLHSLLHTAEQHEIRTLHARPARAVKWTRYGSIAHRLHPLRLNPSHLQRHTSWASLHAASRLKGATTRQHTLHRILHAV